MSRGTLVEYGPFSAIVRRAKKAFPPTVKAAHVFSLVALRHTRVRVANDGEIEFF
jgi:predicted dinucleotide-utilizing enzyme